MAQPKHVERRLQFAAGVIVADRTRYFDTTPVEPFRLIDAPQFLQRLGSMKVSSRVVRIVVEQLDELVDRRRQIAGVDVLHRQTVAAEAIGRILFHHRSQYFKTIGCHSHLLL